MGVKLRVDPVAQFSAVQDEVRKTMVKLRVAIEPVIEYVQAREPAQENLTEAPVLGNTTNDNRHADLMQQIVKTKLSKSSFHDEIRERIERPDLRQSR